MFLATFSAAIFANAVPHDPDPMTATLCLREDKGERGSLSLTGEDGRVAAGVVSVEDGESTSRSENCRSRAGDADALDMSVVFVIDLIEKLKATMDVLGCESMYVVNTQNQVGLAIR